MKPQHTTKRNKTVGHAGGKMTYAEREEVYAQAYASVSNASDILVVGGGPIGIEMCGEINEVFPEKSVTLVTSRELMPSPDVEFPAKFRTRLATKLQSIGVAVNTDGGRVSFNPDDVDACGFIVGKKVGHSVQ